MKNQVTAIPHTPSDIFFNQKTYVTYWIGSNSTCKCSFICVSQHVCWHLLQPPWHRCSFNCVPIDMTMGGPSATLPVLHSWDWVFDTARAFAAWSFYSMDCFTFQSSELPQGDFTYGDEGGGGDQTPGPWTRWFTKKIHTTFREDKQIQIK